MSPLLTIALLVLATTGMLFLFVLIKCSDNSIEKDLKDAIDKTYEKDQQEKDKD